MRLANIPVYDCLIGAAIGFSILHPISMIIIISSINGSMSITPVIFDILSLKHLPMGIYFLILGGLFGVLSGYFRIQLKKQNTILEETLSEKNSLLRVLSHDLTNHINSSNELLRLSLEEENAKNAPEMLESDVRAVVSSLSQAAELINCTRELMALESGKINIDTQQHDIAKLVKEIVPSYQTMCQKKNLTIRINCHATACVAFVDPVIFKFSIMGNLLSNAIKFSYESNIIDVEVKDKNSNYIILTITNHGPGIEPNKKAKLFLPNEKTTTDGTSGEKGTGLGLPLVKKYIELMKGSVEVSSEQFDSAGYEFKTSFSIHLKSNETTYLTNGKVLLT